MPHNIASNCLCLIYSRSNKDFYAVKPGSPFLYEQAFRIQKDVQEHHSIRWPVDGIDAETALVFQYDSEDFLRFMQSGPVSRAQVKRILLDVLNGIVAMHRSDWVHCGIRNFYDSVWTLLITDKWRNRHKIK